MKVSDSTTNQGVIDKTINQGATSEEKTNIVTEESDVTPGQAATSGTTKLSGSPVAGGNSSNLTKADEINQI